MMVMNIALQSTVILHPRVVGLATLEKHRPLLLHPFIKGLLLFGAYFVFN